MKESRAYADRPGDPTRDDRARCVRAATVAERGDSGAMQRQVITGTLLAAIAASAVAIADPAALSAVLDEREAEGLAFVAVIARGDEILFAAQSTRYHHETNARSTPTVTDAIPATRRAGSVVHKTSPLMAVSPRTITTRSTIKPPTSPLRLP